MFYSARVRLAMKKYLSEHRHEDRSPFPQFEVPLFVRDNGGGYTARFGRLGIQGVYFETPQIHRLGEFIEVKIALVGLGIEVRTTCKVISMLHTGEYARVAAKFCDIPFETERMIARWLDMLNLAHRKFAAA